MKTPLFPLLALTPFALSAALGAVASASARDLIPPASIGVPRGSPVGVAVAVADPPCPGSDTGTENGHGHAHGHEVYGLASDVLPPDTPPRVEAAAIPAFDDDLPEGKSPPPIFREWARASEFELLRAPADCRGYRVREWVRVKCDLSREEFVSSSLLAGNREGVSFGHNEFGQGYDVVFPVRKGDRRVFQILKIGAWSKYTVEHDVAFVISEAWPAGDRAPVIAVN